MILEELTRKACSSFKITLNVIKIAGLMGKCHGQTLRKAVMFQLVCKLTGSRAFQKAFGPFC